MSREAADGLHRTQKWPQHYTVLPIKTWNLLLYPLHLGWHFGEWDAEAARLERVLAWASADLSASALPLVELCCHCATKARRGCWRTGGPTGQREVSQLSAPSQLAS